MKRPVFCLRKTLYPKPINFLFSKKIISLSPFNGNRAFVKNMRKICGAKEKKIIKRLVERQKFFLLPLKNLHTLNFLTWSRAAARLIVAVPIEMSQIP